MPHRVRVYRPTNTEIIQAKEIREILRQSRAALELPMPDTFLGRPRPAPPELLSDGENDLLRPDERESC